MMSGLNTQETFIPSNCGVDIEIQDSFLESKNPGWNNAYGNIGIDGITYPNATYKWIIQPITGQFSLNMIIGISSERSNKTKHIWIKNKNGFYGYHYSGRVYALNSKIETNVNYIAGDKVTMEIDIAKRTITFRKNNIFIYQIKNMDISRKYWLAIALSECGAILESFQFNSGNVDEQKQNISYNINNNNNNNKKKIHQPQRLNIIEDSLEKMVEDLKKRLLDQLKVIDELKQTNNTQSKTIKELEYELTEERKAGKLELQQSLIRANEEMNRLQDHLDNREQTIVRLQTESLALSHKNESLQREVNNAKMMEEEKKEDDIKEKGLKDDLILLADGMNEFNTKYDRNMLLKMYDNNADSLFVEEDIENTELSCKSLQKHLQDIKTYVISVTKPDLSKYKTWDINTTMIWIGSLDNGYFAKYTDKLRIGFESDGVNAQNLPDISQSDLREKPFEIQLLMDRKKLVQHFQSLKQNKIAPAAVDNEGAQTAYI